MIDVNSNARQYLLVNIFKRLLTPKPKKIAQTVQTSQASLVLRSGDALPIKIRKSNATRRLKLRIERTGKAVIVSGPLALSDRRAILFANQSMEWIEGQLSKLPRQIPFEIGAMITLYGEPTRLEIAPPRTKPIQESGMLKIPCLPINFETKAKVVLKKMALEAANTHLAQIGPLLSKTPTKVRITDTKSRWGSCSSNGVISLCWRLVLMPPEVFKYVLVHELAHLKEMNHSALFWAEVERIFPQYKVHNKWIKNNGAKLYLIG